MKLGVFRGHGAKNSAPVFDAFCQGAQKLGWQCRDHDSTADVAVIWSVLWHGRMRRNLEVWQQFTATGRPVIVLEVGMLRRGHTWKMGINGVNARATWCPPIIDDRAQKLGIALMPWRRQGDHVLIALQRSDSQQWHEMPDTQTWLQHTISVLRQYTDRPIVIRQHPRQKVSIPSDARTSLPVLVPGSYDNFDLDRDFARAWAVINANSGPGSQAVIHGIPAFVHESSLASPVANLDLTQIENPRRPERQPWLEAVCHTEWTLPELATGEPQRSLLASH